MNATRIDGHAHFHPSFSLAPYLDGAERNFRHRVASYTPITAVLMLAQMDMEGPLKQIEQAASRVCSRWRYSRLDRTSCVFENDLTKIVMIAGRQIVTQEKLELLVLCSDASFSDVLPIENAIERALECGAVPVIPWGFGKWWFARGRVLRALLNSDSPAFLIGDSGCRPALSRSPLMVKAKKVGIGNLAGSDPLPIKSHETRAGRFGTVVPGQVELSAPTAWVRKTLTQLRSAPSFGTLRPMMRFVDDQIRVRFAKKK